MPKRPCLDCGELSNGTRCATCQRKVDRAKGARRKAQRPTASTHAERSRRAAVVQAWREQHGEVCPGYDRPSHRVVPPNLLTADHITPIGLGGREDGPLTVLCRNCNSAKSARSRGSRG